MTAWPGQSQTGNNCIGPVLCAEVYLWVPLVLQLALWTAGIVVLTLLVNAPLMPYLLKWTNLNNASPVKVRPCLQPQSIEPPRRTACLVTAWSLVGMPVCACIEVHWWIWWVHQAQRAGGALVACPRTLWG